MDPKDLGAPPELVSFPCLSSVETFSAANMIPFQLPDSDPAPVPRMEARPRKRRQRSCTRKKAAPYEIAEVEFELLRIEAHRIASLLGQATAIRVRRGEVPIPFPIKPPPLFVWRARACRTLELQSVEGRNRPGPRLLLVLLGREPEEWPKAHELAEAVGHAEESECARLLVGWTWLHEGELRRAERTFADLLRKLELLRYRWRSFEGLALTHAELGRWRLAHAALEAAAESPRCGIGVFVEALHMALRVGEPELVRRSAARLDLLIDPSGPAFATALGLLLVRRERFGNLLLPEGRVRQLFQDLLRSSGSPSGRVANVFAFADS